MSEQAWRDIKFKYGDTEEPIRVIKIQNDKDENRMKLKILKFAGGTISDEIRIKTSKKSQIDLIDLYDVHKEDEPINVELIRASGD